VLRPRDAIPATGDTRLSRRRLLAAGAGAALLLGGARRTGARPVWDERDVAYDHTGTAPGAAAATLTRQEPEPATLSDVARTEPWEALLFLAGRDSRYPGATVDSLMGFSPANILETMDAVVLDAVQASRGSGALGTLYGLIAAHALEALLAVYGDAPLVLALDAGHGGRPGVHHDPGANGTEAWHTRRTVEAIEAAADNPRYASITIRRIFNDAIGDDFGLPPPEDRKGAAALTLRLVRAAMLAREVDSWNTAHPDTPAALHMLSVHYNAGSGGILVLHQGGSMPAEFQGRSIAYARGYVNAARAALNRTGLLPYQLALALGTGLSDDRVLYEPTFRLNRVNPYTGVDRTSFPRRYAMLQSSLLQRDYALGALIYHGLV
jgi:hypothetical protein